MGGAGWQRQVTRKTFSIRKILRAVALIAAGGSPALAEDVAAGCVQKLVDAQYHSPTTRYPHGALGDEEEWAGMRVTAQLNGQCRAGFGGFDVRLPEELVFEDIAPRLWDVTGDGAPEIVVIESHKNKGARLAVWGMTDKGFARLATTSFIGTRFRWLAPLAAADLDGDGAIEIAFVDRPHLAKTLRIWRWNGGQLMEIASLSGLTNHRFGEAIIHGGMRDCGDGPELFLADGEWQTLRAVRLRNGRLTARNIAPIAGPESWEAARACR